MYLYLYTSKLAKMDTWY